MAKQKPFVRAGVDIGGTFTDVAMEAEGRIHSAKVHTDHTEPERAILEGLRIAASIAGIELNSIDLIIHGTTLATNALIERRGAHTGFITTDGFSGTCWKCGRKAALSNTTSTSVCRRPSSGALIG